ncbi:hypothetical protein SAMN02745221_01140 [Thermosyntropha lipolytica DSM 11003]|uniref:Uncharacterized protein n=1 Tax=Thermosyntropha lipolytica DSM 11003 TaxID=1123382 RepID=A0A1M5N9M7_9FIRM|nr:hypothetical protein SAMN02745221_01140 [Thermosyntropha lipolytica DSM 11003]
MPQKRAGGGESRQAKLSEGASELREESLRVSKARFNEGGCSFLSTNQGGTAGKKPVPV